MAKRKRHDDDNEAKEWAEKKRRLDAKSDALWTEKTHHVVAISFASRLTNVPHTGVPFQGWEIHTTNEPVLRQQLLPQLAASMPVLRLVLQYLECETTVWGIGIEAEQSCCETWGCRLEYNGERVSDGATETRVFEAVMGQRILGVRWALRACRREPRQGKPVKERDDDRTKTGYVERAVVDVSLERHNLLQIQMWNDNCNYPHDVGIFCNGLAHDVQTL